MPHKELDSIQWFLYDDRRHRHFVEKKCRKTEYVQHRVCFVKVQQQVTCPHSNIYVKLCTSCLCIKISSFLFVRAWAMPRILYLSCGIPFPVQGSLQKKTPEIYWSFTNREYPPPIQRGFAISVFFPRIFSRGDGQNCEKKFIHFLHISEHIDHF